MPLPPPPKVALSMMGKPKSLAHIKASLIVSIFPLLPGIIGMSASNMASRAATLEPIVAITEDLGPMKIMPALILPEFMIGSWVT